MASGPSRTFSRTYPKVGTRRAYASAVRASLDGIYGPPRRKSVTGGNIPGASNSTGAPSASPTSRPIRDPMIRSCASMIERLCHVVFYALLSAGTGHGKVPQSNFEKGKQQDFQYLFQEKATARS